MCSEWWLGHTVSPMDHTACSTNHTKHCRIHKLICGLEKTYSWDHVPCKLFHGPKTMLHGWLRMFYALLDTFMRNAKCSENFIRGVNKSVQHRMDESKVHSPQTCAVQKKTSSFVHMICFMGHASRSAIPRARSRVHRISTLRIP